MLIKNVSGSDKVFRDPDTGKVLIVKNKETIESNRIGNNEGFVEVKKEKVKKTKEVNE